MFDRRAILNVGMLLRDSLVARRVRTFLLDAADNTVGNITAHPLAALERFSDNLTRAIAIAKVERDRPDVAEAKNRAFAAGIGLSVRVFHKKYFPDVAERRFNQHLYGHGWLIDQRGKGNRDPKRARNRDGRQHRHPTAKGKPFFYLHGSVPSDRRFGNVHIRAGDPEPELRDQLAAAGLPVGDQPGLFALEAA